MAMEPITLFSRLDGLAVVARTLRAHCPGLQLDGPDDDWRNAVATFEVNDEPRQLTLTYDPDYLGGASRDVQMSGMRNFLSRWPDSPNKRRALMLPSTFVFSLGTLFDPDFDPDGDPRLTALFAVAAEIDAVLFTPSSLRDAEGRVLFGAGEDENPDAVWPQVIGTVSMADGIGAVMHEHSRPRSPNEAEPDGIDPPSAERVYRRALAMTAVTIRAILEQDADRDLDDAKDSYRHLIEWVEARDLGEELEEDEAAALNYEPGELPERLQINTTWRLEGLAVLAWALGKIEMPPHDELVSFNDMWQTLGWPDIEFAAEEPILRPRHEIITLRNRLFSLHWRLRDYRVRPRVMDFAAFAKTCSFGPLDLTGLTLVEGDLAIGGERIDRAHPGLVGRTNSAAMERHLAVNWLWEGPETYSDASVAT